MFEGRVLVITGAGVSAESGIPTFRGKDGYWRNLDPAKLATPEAFADDPALVWQWYRERRARIRSAEPNPAHVAITRLSLEARDFLLVSQNVDNLHLRAKWNGRRMPSERLVQIHGDIFVTRCSRCDVRVREDLQDAHDLPGCEACGSLMRPGVVWFGEQLNARDMQRVEDFLAGGACDVAIVAGTTAMFAYVLDWAARAARSSGRLIEVNPEATSLSRFATESLRAPAGLALPKLVEKIMAASS
jgi:NAD-dependent deacetylase